MKKYLINYLLPVLFIFIFPIFISIFNLFNIDVPIIIKLLLTNIFFFIYGYITSKNISKKIIYNSLIRGIIIVFIIFILSLIFISGFNLYTILYYLIILLSVILGTIFRTLKK